MVLLVVGLFCLYFDLSLLLFLLLLLARAGIEFYARLMAANLLALCVFDKHLLAPWTGAEVWRGGAGKGAQLMDVGSQGLVLVVVLWLDNGYGIGSFLGLMRRMIYFYVVFYFHSSFCPEQGKYTYCTVKEGNGGGGLRQTYVAGAVPGDLATLCVRHDSFLLKP